MNFYNCLRLLNECVKAGLIQLSSENSNDILVYRQAGNSSPEGWYAENIFTVAQELMLDLEGQKFLACALKDAGIEFQEENFQRRELK